VFRSSSRWLPFARHEDLRGSAGKAPLRKSELRPAVKKLYQLRPAVKKLHQLRPAVKKLYQLRPAVKKLYQLRPKVSASRVSLASRVVNPKHDELRPAVKQGNAPVVSQDTGVQNVQKLECSYTVLLYFTLYTSICTHTELLHDTDNTVV
jgi:hypothetical protein